MKQLTINPNNRQYYSEDFIKGFECGTQRQLEADKADIPTWIPCSKKLPINDDWVIISILDEMGDTPYRYSGFGWYLEAAKCWIVESEQRTDVVAWMPLPELWEGADDERY